MPPEISIGRPRPNAVVVPGQDFEVSGIAFDRGYPEPITIDSVTVRVDNGPEIDATLTPGLPDVDTVYNFEAQARVSATPGPHTIAVTAVNDQRRSVMDYVTVLVGVGPLISDCTGTATLITSSTDPKLMMPNPAGFAARVEFSFDRSSVRIITVPPIVMHVTVPIVGSVTVIISRRPGESAGSFTPLTGAMTLPIGLHIAYAGRKSDVDFGFPTGSPLTTGTVTSPLGSLSATGSPRNTSGDIRLVGASRFTGDAPLGGLECTLSMSGRLSPIP